MEEKQFNIDEFSISVVDGLSAINLGDFTAAEVERTRRFEFSNRRVPKIGNLENMRLLVSYNGAGSGTCKIEYIEHVSKRRIISGITRVGLIDANRKIIVSWEHPLFHECGRHSRVFAATISRDIAEKVTGLSFRTVGNASATRC